MARKKVTLAWISNDAKRRATLKKRRNGLFKKVNELSTLCDVPACAIVYAPDEAQPEVWPMEPEAKRILEHLKAMPESEQRKKRVNQEGFAMQRMVKLEEQIFKQQREIRELEMKIVMHQCTAGRKLVDLGIEDLGILERLVDDTLKDVHERIVQVRNLNPNLNSNPDAIIVREEKPIMMMDGCHGGGGGYLDDVVMKKPCMGSYENMLALMDASSFYPF
ncbi:uncharacterized protein A4U43_C07F34000 [Asparagus officinalis]|uniref:MADS-box domain-containing protein n=1 Tax=Asparagus officinalis TaxID=4686 RepID=A0A5P1EKL7_ASPOF|nr:agamous-like MADS-box protein AGL80 [Asparagus officinalis]ONK65131.1 uncharacterized protein A4U43_C07F34000 [Asparagus officinalis]